MGFIITVLLSLSKILLGLWTLCLAWTLNYTELGAAIEGVMKKVASFEKLSSRIIAGTMWFLLLTPAFCVRFACHQLYRIIFAKGSPVAYAMAGDTPATDAASSETDSEPNSGSEIVEE